MIKRTFLSSLIALCLFACGGGGHSAPHVVPHVFPTTQPTTAPTTQPSTSPATEPTTQAASIACPDTNSLIAALAIARTTPNTHILLTSATPYIILSELVTQGHGTTIDGQNIATLITLANFTGLNDPLTGKPTNGTCFLITPTFGEVTPFAFQVPGYWFFPPGSLAAINTAAGGTPQAFFEQSPCRDALTAISSDVYPYPLSAARLIPADGITIENLKIQFGSPFCDSALIVGAAQNITIKNVHITNLPPRDMGQANHGDMWTDGSQNVTFDGCTSPAGIALNSSTNCAVINSTMQYVTFEEGCRSCTVTKNALGHARINDLPCTDITFDSNTFSFTGNDIVSVSGGTRITFINNTAAGDVGTGPDARQCVFQHNHGPSFVDGSPASAGNVFGDNSP